MSKGRKRFNIKNIMEKPTKLVAGIIVLLLLVVLTLNFENIKIGTLKLLNALGFYNEEVKDVMIKQDGYDDNKSATWAVSKSVSWKDLNTTSLSYSVHVNPLVPEEHLKDIVLIIDSSASMGNNWGLSDTKDYTKNLIDYLLDSKENRVAIITFNETATILSDFTNDKAKVLELIDGIKAEGNANLYKPLLELEKLMNNYQPQEGRDTTSIFISDEQLNFRKTNILGQYKLLKEKHPYLNFRQLLYDKNSTFNYTNEVTTSLGTNLTDICMWVGANERETQRMLDILFYFTYMDDGQRLDYEVFNVTDEIDDHWYIESEKDLDAYGGEAKLIEENGKQKIIWTLGENDVRSTSDMYGNKKINLEQLFNYREKNFNSRHYPNLKITLKLKDKYIGKRDFFGMTKNDAVIEYRTEKESNVHIKKETKIPVIQYGYDVIYDDNMPAQCGKSTQTKELHFTYEKVSKKSETPSCEGYLFAGWEIVEDNLNMVNSNTFVMPEKNVNIRGTWTKQTIAKEMDGTVYEKTTLYKHLEQEAKTSEFIKQYTGDHKDSFTGTGDQNIYYYTSPNKIEDFGDRFKVYSDTIDSSHSWKYEEDGRAFYYDYNAYSSEISIPLSNGLNYAVFAGMCWQIVRTTDTGGIKMFFRGNTDSNGTCDYANQSDRGWTSGTSTVYFGSPIYISSSYEFDENTGKFKLTGELEQVELTYDFVTGYGTIYHDDDDFRDKIRNKYTCQSGNPDATCSSLYYIVPQATDLTHRSPYYKAVVISPNGYIQRDFGSGEYMPGGSMADVGYMNNKRYGFTSISSSLPSSSIKFTNQRRDYIGNAKYWLADSVSYDSTTKKYQLVNTFKLSSVDDYEQLKGKYTFFSTGDGTYTYVYYIYDVKVTNGYIQYLYQQLEENNSIESYATYYTYGDDYQINEDGTFTILNPTTITQYDFEIDDLRFDKKIVCKGESATCKDPMRINGKISGTASSYYGSKKFSNSFTYKDGKYILDDEDSEYYGWTQPDSSKVQDKHYTCNNESGECEKLIYLVNYFSSGMQYGLLLENGKDGKDYIDEMLHAEDINKNDSVIKATLDLWYEHYMKDYEEYLDDDFVLCNNRSFIPGSEQLFEDSKYLSEGKTPDLYCKNVTDTFSTKNDKAKLKYPVGLLTLAEARLMNSEYFYTDGATAYSSSPVTAFGAYGQTVGLASNYNSGASVYGSYAIRPTIILRPGIEYTSGTGSKKDPYVIEVN